MSNTINNFKKAIVGLSDKKILQNQEARFISKYKVSLTIFVILINALALFIFFFTNCLSTEIAIAGFTSVIFLARAYICPSIKRISVMILSFLPVLFLINLYGHIDISPDSVPNSVSIQQDTANQLPQIRFSSEDTIYAMSLKIVSEYLTHKTDWIAIIIAVYSLIYAIYTWRSQEKTQQNTQRITPEIQKGILKDFFRHSYRNLIVLAAMKYKLEQQGYDKFYPADYHLLKLHTDENSIYPETFVSNEKFCARMHEFKLIVRNGNLEIDTINELMKNRKIDSKIKKKDLGMINSRINLIVDTTASVIKELYNISDKTLSEELESYFKEGTQKTTKAVDKEVRIINAMNNEESVKAHLYARAKEETGEEDGYQKDNVYCEALVKVMFPPRKKANGKKEYDAATLEKQESFMTKMNAEIFDMLNDVDLISYGED